MKIAIVGLGPAGLTAALALRDQGHEPLLYEARNRVGGRIWTVRKEGLVFEAGGEWIDTDNPLFIALIQRMGLTMEPSHQWPGRVLFQGEESNERDLWPDVVADVEAFEEEADLLSADLEPDPAANILYPQLDDQTLGALVRRNAKSERGRFVLTGSLRSDEGDDLERIGLLGWLCFAMRYAEREEGAMSAFRIQEGGQVLWETVLKATGLTPSLENPLTEVEWAHDSALLHFERGSLAVDKVILAIPPTCLRNIRFDPPLPDSIAGAIENRPMSRTVKIALAFKEAFWKDSGWSGRALVDLPIQQIWDGTRGATAVMNCYVCGGETDHFRDHGDPVALALSYIAQIDPRATELFIEGQFTDWIDDEWAGGGFSIVPPGYALGHFADIAKAVGPIHFAGEHTSDWVGFIEGAIQSGYRTAEEVLASAVGG